MALLITPLSASPAAVLPVKHIIAAIWNARKIDMNLFNDTHPHNAALLRQVHFVNVVLGIVQFPKQRNNTII